MRGEVGIKWVRRKGAEGKWGRSQGEGKKVYGKVWGVKKKEKINIYNLIDLFLSPL